MLGLFLGLILAAPAAAAGQPVRYDGHVLVEVDLATAADIARLLDLGLDVWTEHPRPGATAVVRVAPSERALLDASGLPYVLHTIDLQAKVDTERARLVARPLAAPGDVFFDDFRDYDEIMARLDVLAAEMPQLAETIELGDSLEGRPIRGLKISTPGPPERPAIVVDGTQHAREWISPMVTMCIADELVHGEADPNIASLLDQIEVFVVPVVNPDGYAWSWTMERFWRKNRRDEVGVDTNRNFSVGFGGPGASADPMSGNYHGGAPFSEPETVALRDLLLAQPNIVSHLDVHSYGQLVLYPWSLSHEPAPAQVELAALAESIAAAMLAINGVEYDPIQAADLYLAAGTAPDWTYGELGVWSMTIELRPDDADPFEDGFVLPPETIRDVCDEAFAGFLVHAEWTASVEPADPGDDGTPPAESSTGASSEGGLDGTDTQDATSGSTSHGDDLSGGTSGPASTSGAASSTFGDVSDDDGGGVNDGDTQSSCACAARPRATVVALPWLIVLWARRRPARH